MAQETTIDVFHGWGKLVSSLQKQRSTSILGRAQRLTRPKCAILGKITRHIKNFFGRFQREERNEKWTTTRYGERGEKRELLTFTLRHRAHDFPTFSGFNFPSAYFEICTVVRLESVGLVLKNASAPPRRVATTWKVSPPPCTFSTLKFHFFANLFNWSFRFVYYIEGVFWPARSFLVDTKNFFAN